MHTHTRTHTHTHTQVAFEVVTTRQFDTLAHTHTDAHIHTCTHTHTHTHTQVAFEVVTTRQFDMFVAVYIVLNVLFMTVESFKMSSTQVGLTTLSSSLSLSQPLSLSFLPHTCHHTSPSSSLSLSGQTIWSNNLLLTRHSSPSQQQSCPPR